MQVRQLKALGVGWLPVLVGQSGLGYYELDFILIVLSLLPDVGARFEGLS